jgi:hypothetical protein
MIGTLPETMRRYRIPDNKCLDNYWPLPYRLCHALVRHLPIGAVNRFASTKSLMAVRSNAEKPPKINRRT